MTASTRHPSRLVGLAMVGGLLATGVAACGSSSSTAASKSSSTLSSKQAASLTPVDLFGTSLSSVADTSAQTVTFKFGGTQADLDKLLSTDPTTTAKDKAIAEKILLGQLTYAVTTTDGSKLSAAAKTPGKTDASFALVANGSSLVEIRDIAGDLYLRADVPTIATLAGQDPSTLSAETAQLPTQFSFLSDAIKGNWLEISKTDLASLESTIKMAAAAQASASAAPSISVNPMALTADLKAAIEKDATVTKGTDDPTLGTQLIVTAQTKATSADIIAVLQKDIPQLDSALSSASQDSVTDRKVTFDAYVKNGVLTRIAIDAGQFDTKDTPQPVAPLDLDFKPTADAIAAPTASTPIPVAALLQQYGSALGGLGGSLTGVLGGIANKA